MAKEPKIFTSVLSYIINNSTENYSLNKGVKNNKHMKDRKRISLSNIMCGRTGLLLRNNY